MKQFFKAIDFIEAHLEDEITLADVAAAACYSDYHFSRMFRAIVGETVAGYVRKRRLSIAAERMLREDIRLIDLALESGFESQQAFTRAFKKMFGITPGEHRRRSRPVRHQYRTVFTPDLLNHLKKGMSMEPKIMERAGFKAIGLSLKMTQQETGEIPALWGQLGQRAAEVPNKTCGPAYGICADWKGGRASDSFTYTAAVEVSSLDEVPEGMRGIEVPDQTYAVFTHKMTSQDIPKDIQVTMRHIWGTWLPNSEYECAGTPDFELYDERFDPVKLTGEFDIYIPIRKKA